MTRYLASRFAGMVIVMLLVATLVFFITRLAPGCGVEPPSQPRLLHVAELARDGDAPLVLGLGVDLDPVGAAELEPDACERGSGLGPEPGAGLRRADPVADLECALADPPVQTAPTALFARRHTHPCAFSPPSLATRNQ